MPAKPIRVLYNPITERFWATQHYHEIIENNRIHTRITGKKYDVTQDVARAIVEHGVEFVPDDRIEDCEATDAIERAGEAPERCNLYREVVTDHEGRYWYAHREPDDMADADKVAVHVLTDSNQSDMFDFWQAYDALNAQGFAVKEPVMILKADGIP